MPQACICVGLALALEIPTSITESLITRNIYRYEWSTYAAANRSSLAHGQFIGSVQNVSSDRTTWDDLLCVILHLADRLDDHANDISVVSAATEVAIDASTRPYRIPRQFRPEASSHHCHQAIDELGRFPLHRSGRFSRLLGQASVDTSYEQFVHDPPRTQGRARFGAGEGLRETAVVQVAEPDKPLDHRPYGIGRVAEASQSSLHLDLRTVSIAQVSESPGARGTLIPLLQQALQIVAGDTHPSGQPKIHDEGWVYDERPTPHQPDAGAAGIARIRADALDFSVLRIPMLPLGIRVAACRTPAERTLSIHALVRRREQRPLRSLRGPPEQEREQPASG